MLGQMTGMYYFSAGGYQPTAYQSSAQQNPYANTQCYQNMQSCYYPQQNYYPQTSVSGQNLNFSSMPGSLMSQSYTSFGSTFNSGYNTGTWQTAQAAQSYNNPTYSAQQYCPPAQNFFNPQLIMMLLSFITQQKNERTNQLLEKITCQNNKVNNLADNITKTYIDNVDKDKVDTLQTASENVSEKAATSGNAEAVAEADKAAELAEKANEKMQELQEMLIDNLELKDDANDATEDALDGNASLTKTLKELKTIRNSLAGMAETMPEEIDELDTFIADAEAQIAKANYAVKGGLEFDKINSNDDNIILKSEIKDHLTSLGLKDSVNTNLKDFVLSNLASDIGGEDEKINKTEFFSYLDTNNDEIAEKTEIDALNSKFQTNTNTLNNAKVWQADKDYGWIDWNQDGVFKNDGGGNGFLTTHGDLDNFFTGLGSYFKVNNFTTLINDKDNTSADKDSREGFLSNGTVTAHKISDTQTGVTITSKDMSNAAGVNYNYAIYDSVKNSYIIGNDKNTDGFLKDDEILGIVENVGESSKTASPLTFDLDGNGTVDTSNTEKDFDVDGNGKTDKTAWAAAGDGVLVFDADKNGIAGEDGKEIFGNNTDVDGDGKSDEKANGFEALKSLADKLLGTDSVADNKLDAAEIKALEEKAGLKMSVVGNDNKETQKTLSELGITEIKLGYAEAAEEDIKDKNGNEHRQVGEGFTMNGEEKAVDDVWLRYN